MHLIDLPSPERIGVAHGALRGTVRLTPLIESDVLARDCGAARLFVKAEGLQRTGSFKLRGALWRLMQLTAGERARWRSQAGILRKGLPRRGAIWGCR